MSGGVDPDELQTAAFFYDQKLQQNENSTYHHSLGALQLYKRNFDQAGNEFKKAVEVNPGNIGARNDLAVHYLKFGKYYDAEKQLSAAIVCITVTMIPKVLLKSIANFYLFMYFCFIFVLSDNFLYLIRFLRVMEQINLSCIETCQLHSLELVDTKKLIYIVEKPFN